MSTHVTRRFWFIAGVCELIAGTGLLVARVRVAPLSLSLSSPGSLVMSAVILALGILSMTWAFEPSRRRLPTRSAPTAPRAAPQG